jgi:hypothetical protein
MKKSVSISEIFSLILVQVEILHFHHRGTARPKAAAKDSPQRHGEHRENNDVQKNLAKKTRFSGLVIQRAQILISLDFLCDLRASVVSNKRRS